MTKKTEGANNAAAVAKLANKLREMREKIDKLDQHLLKLVNERAGVAADIGRLKNDTSAEPFAPAREEEVSRTFCNRTRARWTTTPSGPFSAKSSAARALFRKSSR